MDVTKTPATGLTLLIVEDEILPALALREAFEDAGYRVLDLTGRHQAALAEARAEKPDIALVNIHLEGDDDGIALARDLKAMGVPSIFISGQVSRARSANTEAIGSLPKPYRTADMVVAVAYMMGLRNGDETLPRPPGLEVFEGAFGAIPDAA